MGIRAPIRARPTLLVGLPALVSVLAVGLARVIHAPTALWDTAWTASELSALCAMVLACRSAAAEHRFRWVMWTAAVAVAFTAQVIWDVYGDSVPASPNLNDILDWLFAVLMMVGVFRSAAGGRSRSLRAVVVLETLPLIASALALSSAELWHFAEASSLASAPRISALVYPALYVACAIVTLQAMVGGWLRGVSSAPSQLVLLGIVAMAVAFSCWSAQLLQQTYVEGSSLLDPLWVVGMLAIAAGAFLAARSPDAVAAVRPRPGWSGVLPAAMFLALLAALARNQFIDASDTPDIFLSVGLLFTGASLVLRGHLLSRRLEALLARERGTVANLEEREFELARINERLVEDSRHDALTGMRNRRALGHDLPRVEAQHREQGQSFALAVCDIDHFKTYNDRFGHLAGDHALRTIACTVRDALRDGDVGYRFGGEELLLVLPDALAGEALTAAERVRAAVEAAALPHPDGVDGVLTVSIGVASGCVDAAALLARADAALYEAKRAGRNRVVAASGDQGGGRDRVIRARRSSDEESVPRQLRSMLAVSRAAASGTGVMPVLQALADMIRHELSFEVVAVNLRDFERDELEVVVVLGDEDARDALLHSRNPWRDFEVLITPEHERCGAIWLPAGSDIGALKTWDPEYIVDDDPRAWRPDDMLLLPVRGSAGEVLGVVSVDRPLSGRRPEDDELGVLMAVADHAGLALERARRDSEDAAAFRAQSAELRLAAVMLLAETLDLRDPGTGAHSRTVGHHARRIAASLGLAAERVERIHAAGVVHDLGKLGIADAILYKRGSLDEHEWREVKRHSEIGARILEHAGLGDIARWVRSHHERIDGLGYPDRLRAEEIPLESKILAVADAYEAMTADRPYRQGMRPELARDELLRCVGTQFDEAVVEAFLQALGSADEPSPAPDLDELRILA